MCSYWFRFFIYVCTVESYYPAWSSSEPKTLFYAFLLYYSFKNDMICSFVDPLINPVIIMYKLTTSFPFWEAPLAVLLLFASDLMLLIVANQTKGFCGVSARMCLIIYNFWFVFKGREIAWRHEVFHLKQTMRHLAVLVPRPDREEESERVGAERSLHGRVCSID